MRHKDKVKLAIKMAGKVKKRDVGKKFMSKAWGERKKAIAERHQRKQARAHQKATERRNNERNSSKKTQEEIQT